MTWRRAGAGRPAERQVFEASPPAADGDRVPGRAKQCPDCGRSPSAGPAGVTGRAQYGPLVHAKAALAVCANYLPVAAPPGWSRLTGVRVSAGFAAGVRARPPPCSARSWTASGSCCRAPVLYAARPPRQGSSATSTWPAPSSSPPCTRRPDQRGHRLRRHPARILRHHRPRRLQGLRALTIALHAWCGAHGPRPGRAVPLRPDGQVWPGPWRPAHRRQRQGGAPAGPARHLSDASLADPSWYRGAVAKGIADNAGSAPRPPWTGPGCRRFRDHEDMILRFATDLAVGFTSNQAERDIRPSRSSSAPPAAPGAPCSGSPTSHRRVLPVTPPNGASTPSTPHMPLPAALLPRSRTRNTQRAKPPSRKSRLPAHPPPAGHHACPQPVHSRPTQLNSYTKSPS